MNPILPFVRRPLFVALLTLAMLLNPLQVVADTTTPGLSDFVPRVEGLDENTPLPEDTSPRSLPPVLLQIAKERARQEAAEPIAFRKKLMRKIKSYFPSSQTPTASPQVDGRAQLLADAISVFREFESNDTSGEFVGFAEQKLAPFIASLNAELIENPIRGNVVTEPIAEWTVQTLVVKQMVGFLGRYKDFSKRALDLVVGKHLKGASYVAATIITWTVLHHFFPGGTVALAGSVLETLWFLIKAGPFAAVTTAGAGFFVRPTTELVKTLGARMTGNLEARINNGYDHLVGKYFSNGSPEQNDRVRIATMDEQSTDFGGMLPEDQLKNWAKGLNMFIVVQNLFGRLLRDTHHAGRDLMMLAWTDAQNISQLVELLDTKEHVLQELQMSILAPYRNAMINRGDFEAKNEFNRRVKAFDQLTAQVWLNPDADQIEIDRLAGEIETAANALRVYGLADDELKDLLNIQRNRGRAIGKLVTAAAIGHMRSFYGAERNRNLAEDARRIAQSIQIGLGTEEYTEQYLPLVRRQMRLMGMEYSNPDAPAPANDPASLKLEDCFVRELRRSLSIPATASPATYACVNALIGYKSLNALKSQPDSPISQLLAGVRSQGIRMEISGLLKYAATVSDGKINLQQSAQSVLDRCQ